MKTLITVALILSLIACAKTETASQTETAALPTAAVKTYPMNGVIVSRNAANNTVNIDNENVPGVMAPMKMDYELRGATVDSLPPDGSKVQMTLHDQDGKYWVTDVKLRQ
jgi:Cu/Ag efflux protein CusF